VSTDLTHYVEDVVGTIVEADDWQDPEGYDQWLEDSLELVGIYRQSYGHDSTPVLDAVEVLVCYGGPTVRVTFDGDYALVVGVWGTDRVERVAYVHALSAYVIDVADSMAVGR
jgi:hypothetical protein